MMPVVISEAELQEIKYEVRNLIDQWSREYEEDKRRRKIKRWRANRRPDIPQANASNHQPAASETRSPFVKDSGRRF